MRLPRFFPNNNENRSTGLDCSEGSRRWVGTVWRNGCARAREEDRLHPCFSRCAEFFRRVGKEEDGAWRKIELGSNGAVGGSFSFAADLGVKVTGKEGRHISIDRITEEKFLSRDRS